MRDNWCVGFSDRYTVGVWVGNFSGTPMWSMSGVTGAAPIWIEVMNYLHNREKARLRKVPAGLVQQQVRWEETGVTRNEWFLKGTETEIVAEAKGAKRPKIVYPATGTIVAVDPDIPINHQKLFFDLEPRAASAAWVLDGKEIGSADSAVAWLPKRGRHELSVIDPTGIRLDSVKFEVRGGR